jgi:ATP-dependent DNA helicase RecG
LILARPSVDEKSLREYLKSLYPKENEACEWKEFKNLRHAWSGKKGEDVESYISAIANMRGGHIVIGVKDKTIDIIGIDHFADYTVENAKPRLAGRCANLNTEKLRITEYVTEDSEDCLGHRSAPA